MLVGGGLLPGGTGEWGGVVPPRPHQPQLKGSRLKATPSLSPRAECRFGNLLETLLEAFWKPFRNLFWVAEVAGNWLETFLKPFRNLFSGFDVSETFFQRCGVGAFGSPRGKAARPRELRNFPRVVAGGLAWPNTARPLIRSHREGSAIKTVGRAGAGLGWSRLWTRRPSAVESKSAKSAYLLRRFLVAILAQALSVTFFTALCRSSRRVLRPWGHTTKALAALALVPRLRESDGTRTGPLGV